jgi:hypothetical protein
MWQPRDLADHLATLCERLKEERRRAYSAPWSDWPEGNTGRHEYPVVYALWSSPDASRPLYIGKTEGLGARSWAHFAAEGWSLRPTHVSYVEDASFRDPAMLFAFEKFATMVLDPSDNDRRR